MNELGGFNLFLPKREKYVSCLLKENMDQKQTKNPFLTNCIIILFVWLSFSVNSIDVEVEC